MTNLDSVLKSRDITLLTKVCIVKASSHVWMWKLDHKEGWAQNNWCFWTVVLEKTLESPLDCKEIQPVHSGWIRKSVLNSHWKDWCWSWNSNTLATWCEELTHLKRPWCWERSKVGGEGDDRGWDGWMASLTQWTLSLSELREMVMDREAWRAAIHGVAKIRTRLSDWTELIPYLCSQTGEESFSLKYNSFAWYLLPDHLGFQM